MNKLEIEDCFVDLSKYETWEYRSLVNKLCKSRLDGEVNKNFKYLYFKVPKNIWFVGANPSQRKEVGLKFMEFLIEKATNSNYENLKKYFNETSKEQVKKDWDETAHLDNVGPKLKDWMGSPSC